jgi:hypothetical protein
MVCISWARRRTRKFVCVIRSHIRILQTRAARGAPQAERWDVAAADAIEDLIARATQREQQTGRRRRPFSSRAGFAPLI